MIDTLDYLERHNYSPPYGYKGGKPFNNDGRNGTFHLPEEYAPFKEFDIYPKDPVFGRGAERIIIGNGSGGAVWYTPDHYETAILME